MYILALYEWHGHSVAIKKNLEKNLDILIMYPYNEKACEKKHVLFVRLK